MSAMFEVMLGNAFMMSPQALRFAMVASVAMAEGGVATPRVLQASLIAPYVDGFTFVQALRKREVASKVSIMDFPHQIDLA